MKPIFRRSSFFYWTSLGTYLALMGRYLVTRDWTAFEVIPLFMPVWLAAAMLASEDDESYAFLRTLAVTDRAIVRTKFGTILMSAAIQWALMVGAAMVRIRDGTADPTTVVYLTLIAAAALLLMAWLQTGVWRHGISSMKLALIAGIAGSIVLIILHMAAMKYVDWWPVLSRLPIVRWLGRASWLSSAALVVATLAIFRRMMTVAVRVKASSEAHL